MAVQLFDQVPGALHKAYLLGVHIYFLQIWALPEAVRHGIEQLAEFLIELPIQRMQVPEQPAAAAYRCLKSIAERKSEGDLQTRVFRKNIAV